MGAKGWGQVVGYRNHDAHGAHPPWHSQTAAGGGTNSRSVAALVAQGRHKCNIHGHLTGDEERALPPWADGHRAVQFPLRLLADEAVHPHSSPVMTPCRCRDDSACTGGWNGGDFISRCRGSRSSARGLRKVAVSQGVMGGDGHAVLESRANCLLGLPAAFAAGLPSQCPAGPLTGGPQHQGSR
jgi:hypothetical protein